MFETLHGRIVCRHFHCSGGKWTLREEPPKYAPDRTCDVEHLRLEVAVDLPRKRLKAICTQRLAASYGPFDAVSLDAVDLTIHSVRDGSGKDLPYTYLDGKLQVRFPRKVARSVDLAIAYEVDRPAMGLYFQGPTESDPRATYQLWSQGEDEEARHWIPCHDAPNEKMTTEMIITVDSRYTAISNGALLSVKERKGKKIYHYLESVPHVSYLITLVVGEFVRIADDWRGIPVEYFVERGREKEARRSFGKTPQMMEFFSKVLEYPYPYEKYAQVAIRNFHFGGMENTSATSQTDHTLHDERAAIDFTSDDLVAHELAHQWFGDLLTCKSWAHAWLNEGFATYFEALWKEQDLGRAEFEYEMVLNARSYMAEPYRRAIVNNRYAHPADLFDMHLYPKGAWVLHMLRREVGDDLFWKGMRTYVRRHERGCVETIDLIRALEEASGKNLTAFFDQWVMSPGHPEIEGSVEWDPKGQRLAVSLKQTQKSDGGAPGAFSLPIRVEARLENGERVDRTFRLDRREETFFLALQGRPASVSIDPEQALLATWKVQIPSDWAADVLLGRGRDERTYPRVLAVAQLAEKPTTQNLERLRRVLKGDPFWGVQAESARLLGRIGSPAAFAILRECLSLRHAKSRRAVVTALGSYRTDESAKILKEILRKGDPSYFVEGAAAAALGRTRRPGVAAILRKMIARRSWHDILATHAAEGLAATREEGCVEPLLDLASDRKRYWNCRVTAMRSLAQVAAARPALAPRVVEELSCYLKDPLLLVARNVAGALAATGHEGAIAPLREAAATAVDPRLAGDHLAAVDRLAAQRGRGEDVDRLREELEKLRAETRTIRESLQKLESERTRRKGGKKGRE